MAEDFRRRFYISLILTIPLLYLSPTIQEWFGYEFDFRGKGYMIFAIATALFFYGGWPFLKGLFEELKGKQPGMMTLIGLAILNDIPIMTIATDRVRTAINPVRWNMKRVLTIASVLSVTGVISSFLLYWFLRTHTDFTTKEIQTMIFLKLLVAGHMTIFLTRNTGALWQKPYPSLWLFITLEGTQVIGTLFAVYGILIPDISWAQALIVWGYAFVWIFMLSGVKILTYKILNKYTQVPVTER